MIITCATVFQSEKFWEEMLVNSWVWMEDNYYNGSRGNMM
jgi:hypothetical protein